MLVRLIKTFSKVDEVIPVLEKLIDQIDHMEYDLVKIGEIVNSLLDKGLYNYSGIYSRLELMATARLYEADAYQVLRAFVRLAHFKRYGCDIDPEFRPVRSDILQEIMANWSQIEFSHLEEVKDLIQYIEKRDGVTSP
jgi:hypothetical protein